jgi:hypothetical protein
LVIDAGYARGRPEPANDSLRIESLVLPLDRAAQGHPTIRNGDLTDTPISVGATRASQLSSANTSRWICSSEDRIVEGLGELLLMNLLVLVIGSSPECPWWDRVAI